MLLKSLAAIGLVDTDGLPTAELVARAVAQPGESFSTAHGTYKHVKLDGGAELWIDIGADGSSRPGQMIGITPFHSSTGVVKVEVQGAVVLDHADPMLGAWQVLLPALARGDRPLPLTLEIVPFRLHTLPSPTFTAYVRLIGLASEATVYPSPAAFFDRAPMAKLVSVGGVSPLHNAGGPSDANAEHRCAALVTGQIEEAFQLACPLTGQPYFRLVVMTDRGRFNILAGGRTLLGAAPKRGAVVQARARLVATPAGAEAVSAECADTTPADAIHPAVKVSGMASVNEFAPAARRGGEAAVTVPFPAAAQRCGSDSARAGTAEAPLGDAGQGQQSRRPVFIREVRRG